MRYVTAYEVSEIKRRITTTYVEQVNESDNLVERLVGSYTGFKAGVTPQAIKSQEKPYTTLT